MRSLVFYTVLLFSSSSYASCDFKNVKLPEAGEFFHTTANEFALSVSKLCFDLDAVEVELLERGYAQAFSDAPASHLAAQAFAKKHRFGIWLEINPSPPKR